MPVTTRKRPSQNYNTVIVTPKLRKRQSKALKRVPAVIGGLYGFAFSNSLRGATVGAASGYALGSAANAYVGHNAKRAQRKELAKGKADKRNRAAMMGAMYSSMGTGMSSGLMSHRIPGAYDIKKSTIGRIDHSLHGDKFQFGLSQSEIDSFLDGPSNDALGFLKGLGGGFEVEGKPKDISKISRKGITKRMSKFHAPSFDDNMGIEVGNPWLETRQHNITFGGTKKGKLLQRTEFPSQLSSGFTNYRREKSLLDSFQDDGGRPRLWGSAMHTTDKFHTHVALNTKKARNIGIGAAAGAAVAGGGYYYYRRRKNRMERVRNANRRGGALPAAKKAQKKAVRRRKK